MIEQGRANFAYKSVKNLVDSGKTKNYKSYVRDFPNMIKMNGFGAAMAFCFAKMEKEKEKENAYRELYTQINNWLKERGYVEANKDVMQVITETDSDTYKLLTTETMAYLSWAKRFAEGLIRE